jgi:hypothetical protein
MKETIIVLAVVAAVTLVSLMVSSANRMVTAPPEVVVVADRLQKAMSRSALLAEQHTNAFVAYSEASYAKAYLRALSVLMTDGEIRTSFSIDIRRMTGDLDRIERKALRDMRTLAPNLVPKNSISVGHIP